jgi:hypothetical protein
MSIDCQNTDLTSSAVKNSNKVKEYLENNIINCIYLPFMILANFIWLYIPLLFIIYNLIIGQQTLYKHFILFSWAYIFNNIYFVCSHLMLHTYFKEISSNKAKEVMTKYIYLTYLHHYDNPLIYSMSNFYDYQLMYIFYRHTTNCKNTDYQKYGLSILLSIIIYYINPSISIQLIFWLNFLYCLDHKLLFLFLTCFTISLYLGGLDIALIDISYHLIMQYFQGLAHLWYHTPNKSRKSNYGFFLYNICTMLEYFTIFDTNKHKIHHNHNLTTVNDVEMWYDMRMPEFLNIFIDKIWKFMLTLHVKDQTKMIDFIEFWSGVIIMLFAVVVPYIIFNIII